MAWGGFRRSNSVRHPWRDTKGFGDKRREELIDEIKAIAPKANLNIVLMGVVGAGKSSFFNSIQNAWTGKIIQSAAQTGSMNTSVTKKFQSYSINRDNDEIRVFDTKGLEGMDEESLRVEVNNLIKVALGHVPDTYEFKNGKPFQDDNDDFRKNPSIDMRAHCVAIVINAYSFKHMEKDSFKALLNIREKIMKEEIPLFIVLTHLDKYLSKKGVSKIYHNTKVRDLVQKISDKMHGLPKGQIFPVVNYNDEVELSKYTTDMDVLILIALRQMLLSAENHVEQLIERMRNNPIECCDKP